MSGTPWKVQCVQAGSQERSEQLSGSATPPPGVEGTLRPPRPYLSVNRTSSTTMDSMSSVWRYQMFPCIGSAASP